MQADVIMNLAGSNGGSWSTTTKYSPKPPQNLLHHTTDIESGQLHAISTPPPPGNLQPYYYKSCMQFLVSLEKVKKSKYINWFLKDTQVIEVVCL